MFTSNAVIFEKRSALHSRTTSPQWIDTTELDQPLKKHEVHQPKPSAEELMRQDATTQAANARSFYKHYKASNKPTVCLSPEEVTKILENDVDTVLFDCDGVIYRHMDQCPGAAECIRSLMSHGKQVLFVSNNGAVGRQQLRDKLAKVLDINELKVEQCVSSAYSCAQYVQQQLPEGGRVHLIGTDGLLEEVEDHGFTVFRLDGAPSSMPHKVVEDYDFPGQRFDAVIIGHDTDFNFRKIVMATNILAQNPDALFVATDEDSHDVIGPNSRHIPGNGPLVKCIEASSQRKAVNCGKPGSTLAGLIQKQYGLNLSRCLFVGDRLNSDIRFANENGMKSLLVMTGVTRADTLIALEEGTTENPLPHFIAPYIGYLTL